MNFIGFVVSIISAVNALPQPGGVIIGSQIPTLLPRLPDRDIQ
jgi:hypothetical protein